MIRFLLGSFWFLAVSSTVLGQKTTTYFDVLVDSRLVGQMEATKEIKNDTVKLSIHSNIGTKVLSFDVEIRSELETVSKGKTLLFGKNFQQSNRGEANIASEIRKNGPETYWVSKNGKSRVLNAAQIIGTLTDMYFWEPGNAYIVYSVADADFLQLNPKGNGQYELLLPNGKRNVFTYSKGLLLQMEAPIVVGSVVIRRK